MAFVGYVLYGKRSRPVRGARIEILYFGLPGAGKTVAPRKGRED